MSSSLPEVLLTALKSDGMGALRRRAIVSWEPPGGEPAVFGLGRALELCGPREQGPTAAFDAIRGLSRDAVCGPIDQRARPRFFGGWRFVPMTGADADPRWEPFGGWRFVVPAVTVAVSEGGWAATATAMVAPGDSEAALEAHIAAALGNVDGLPARRRVALGRQVPGPAEWKEAVASALDEIRDGKYEKVVLARQVSVQLGDRMDGADLRARLRDRYPNCWIFGSEAGGSTWLGASPELLVSVQGGIVEAASLAGSRRRGMNAEEDMALSADLMGSRKERLEHALVALAIADGLARFCAPLEVPENPSLLQMQNIQHLYTPIRGRLRNGHDLLDLAAALHPTPAVGGWPRAAALDAIARLEGMDRGWYAAPIGWVDFGGEGVFAVGLRAGLLTGDELTLYAGNGIVAGSEPEAELAETELKLASVRAAALEG